MVFGATTAIGTFALYDLHSPPSLLSLSLSSQSHRHHHGMLINITVGRHPVVFISDLLQQPEGYFAMETGT
jgi:hypothetical protein